MAKKDFTGSTALSFISEEPEKKTSGKKAGSKAEAKKPSKTTAPRGNKAPEGYKNNPEYIETRSKRVQILVQPSLYREAKEISYKLGISVNDFIHRALKEATYSDYVRDLIAKDVKEGR